MDSKSVLQLIAKSPLINNRIVIFQVTDTHESLKTLLLCVLLVEDSVTPSMTTP